MPKVYGRAAVEVVQPGGEVLLYEIRAAPAPPAAWRCWAVTSPDGATHAVSEYPSGRWHCTCKDWKYRSRFDAAKRGRCKHCTAVADELAKAVSTRETERPS